MTFYQFYTRLRHFFRAKHWRGAAIHSPMMYAFVRRFALSYRGERLVAKLRDELGAIVISDPREIDSTINTAIQEPLPQKVNDPALLPCRDDIGLSLQQEQLDFENYNSAVYLLVKPFVSASAETAWWAWYARNHAVVAHFQGVIVIFFDKKLQKQYYLIRN